MSEEFNLVKRGYTRTETSSRLFQCSESVNTELMNVFAIEHNYHKSCDLNFLLLTGHKNFGIGPLG